MSNVFGLDIGTRNVVGTVGYRTEDEKFTVIAQHIREHETRAMLDGQIHDIGRVARTVGHVKAELEKQVGEPLAEVCIAAAGRMLKTVTTRIEMNYPEETQVSGEDIHTLHLLGVEKAQDELKEKNDTRYRFHCVGYSVVRYYLNDEVFSSLEGHKANTIACDIIVTFLPEDVVDGLYTAVGQAGLTVANMTLEPIAAIHVAIPESYRMLNIALVDVGAGTSDISITKEGTIIAYGMIPYAGDELTEVIVQHYLVDFKTAEAIKRQSTTKTEIIYEDIMNISHTITTSDLAEVVAPTIDKITSEVATKIRELNGGQSVNACFVVGGGGKIKGFTEKLAQYLDLPTERVALRGEEVLREVEFLQEGIKKDPLLVTPIGICMNYYEQKNNFIMVRFNGERIQLYDNNHLAIVDAALAAGFPNEQIFPKRGTAINFTVNGAARIARGEAGEPAIVTMNGKPANINTPLEPNSEIVIEPSTMGNNAVYTIDQLEEYTSATVSFIVNGNTVTCPKFVQVNGKLEPGTYEIKEGDVIETRSFYTVGQVAEFMDVELDTDYEIYVNNREADLDTVVYENFSIEWSVLSFGVADELQEVHAPQTTFEQQEEHTTASMHLPYGVENLSSDVSEPEVEVSTVDTEPTVAKADVVPEQPAYEQSVPEQPVHEQITTQYTTSVSQPYPEPTYSARKPAERSLTLDEPIAESVEEPLPKVEPEPVKVGTEIIVFVNGEAVTLSGKDQYIFVDIFERITFDLTESKGRAIATLVNGEEAQFTEVLSHGDKVDLYWKEN